MPLVIDTAVRLYEIETFANKRLDVAGRGRSDRDLVHQWSANGGDNQKWYLDPCGADHYRIISRDSGRVLDAPGAAGEPVWQFSWAGVDNQRWRLEESTDGVVIALVAHPDDDLVLDVRDMSRADGAAIQVYHRTGGENQLFRLLS